MKSLLKKNQLMITSLAIMLAIAGYLQFAGTNLEDEYLQVNDMADAGNMLTDISDEDLLSAGLQEIDSMDEDGAVITENYLSDDMSVIDVPVLSETETGNDAGIPGEAVFTGNTNVNSDGSSNTQNIINNISIKSIISFYSVIYKI